LPTFPGATVLPAQFKPLTKPEPVKPPPVKNFGDKEVPNWREFDESTRKWVPVQFADRNKNGVPDNMEGGAAGAQVAGTVSKPSSMFMQTVQ
jgi:hypothetical protein